jgi:hypothetical protein
MNIYDYSLLVGIHEKKVKFDSPGKSVSLETPRKSIPIDRKSTFDVSSQQQDSGRPCGNTMERLLKQTKLPSITPEEFYSNYLVRYFSQSNLRNPMDNTRSRALTAEPFTHLAS